MDGLLRFARNDAESSVRKHPTTFIPRKRGSRILRENFFIIFVDGIFTTFIEWPFTNVSHAIRENRAISCV